MYSKGYVTSFLAFVILCFLAAVLMYQAPSYLQKKNEEGFQALTTTSQQVQQADSVFDDINRRILDLSRNIIFRLEDAQDHIAWLNTGGKYGPAYHLRKWDLYKPNLWELVRNANPGKNKKSGKPPILVPGKEETGKVFIPEKC